MQLMFASGLSPDGCVRRSCLPAPALLQMRSGSARRIFQPCSFLLGVICDPTAFRLYFGGTYFSVAAGSLIIEMRADTHRCC
jgi:hypothetical protein